MIKEAFEKTLAAKTKTGRYQAQIPVKDQIGELLLYAMEQDRVIAIEHPIYKKDIKRYLDLNKLKPAPSIKVKGPIEAVKNFVAKDECGVRPILEGIYFNKKRQEIVACDRYLLGMFPYKVEEEKLIHYKTGEVTKENFVNYGFIIEDEKNLYKTITLDPYYVLKLARTLEKGNKMYARGCCFVIGVEDINLDPGKVRLAIKGLLESGTKKIELKYGDDNTFHVVFTGDNGGQVALARLSKSNRTEVFTTYLL